MLEIYIFWYLLGLNSAFILLYITSQDNIKHKLMGLKNYTALLYHKLLHSNKEL